MPAYFAANARFTRSSFPKYRTDSRSFSSIDKFDKALSTNSLSSLTFAFCSTSNARYSATFCAGSLPSTERTALFRICSKYPSSMPPKRG